MSAHPPHDTPGAHHPMSGLESLRLLATPAYHQTFFRWAAAVGGVAVLSLFLPWQQNVQATGEVTALAPADRPQTVNAIVGGRIVSWDVREGQAVKAGDPIVHLADVKETYLDPRALQRQREALGANRVPEYSQLFSVLCAVYFG